MQSGKVACITRELEDLLMIEEERGTLQKKNGSVADLLAEMETAVAQVRSAVRKRNRIALPVRRSVRRSVCAGRNGKTKGCSTRQMP